MRFLTWNIRQGGRKNRLQVAERLAHHAPDVVVLTEFRSNEVGEFLWERLDEMGLHHRAAGPAEAKTNTVMIAAREPITVRDGLADHLDRPHRLLDVVVDGIHLTGVHMPNMAAKRPYWQAVIRAGRERLSRPAVVMGDFNTGRHFLDENGATFSSTDLMEEFEAMGFADPWRERNPEAREFTWYSPNAGNGFRLDHVFASPPMQARIRDVRYSHIEREEGLSDHSIMILDCD